MGSGRRTAGRKKGKGSRREREVGGQTVPSLEKTNVKLIRIKTSRFILLTKMNHFSGSNLFVKRVCVCV